MPDISMCQGFNCNIKDNCYRFKAKPSEFRQSWFCKSPNTDALNCDYYWEATKPIQQIVKLNVKKNENKIRKN